MNELTSLCNDANRIAAQLRNRQPLTLKVSLKKPRPVRAYATGIPGKSEYLRVAAEARQADILAYCHAFFHDNDQLPTQLVIANHFGVSQQVAQKYMVRLREAGHIQRNAVDRWAFARSIA